MLWLIRMVLTSVLVGVVVLLSVPLHAQLIVNDPLNYAQNVLTAARSLQQINIALMGWPINSRCCKISIKIC